MCSCNMAPGRNAPAGVEKMYCECMQLESNVQVNNAAHVIHIQSPIVLESSDFNIWLISGL